MTTRTFALTVSLTLGFTLGAAPSIRAADELVSMPEKFYVPGVLEFRFLHLLQRSPTFREQCRVITGAGTVVVVEIAPLADLMRRRVNAWSSILRNAEGRVSFVRVRIADDERWSVHLPHELEHVVEQIEGLDLAGEERRNSGRAWLVAAGTFETQRARRAGEQVDRELHGRDRAARRRGEPRAERRADQPRPAAPPVP